MSPREGDSLEDRTDTFVRFNPCNGTRRLDLDHQPAAPALLASALRSCRASVCRGLLNRVLRGHANRSPAFQIAQPMIYEVRRRLGAKRDTTPAWLQAIRIW